MKLTRIQIGTLALLMFGTFVTVLNQTLVTPALPSIMVETNVSAQTVQWLTSGFTLVNAIMIPITAYLQDRFPLRVLFCVSMGLFALGSCLAGIGTTFALLLAGRLVQACGAGVLMPIAMTVLILTFPPERRGSAMGIFGVVIACAPAIGPTVAGFVIDAYNWHILFWGVTFLAGLVSIAGLIVLPHAKKDKTHVVLDKLSVLLSSVGFGSLLYGFSTMGSHGIDPVDAVITLIGLIAVIVFFWRQLHLEQPMLQVRILWNKTFLLGTLIGMIIQASLLIGGVLLPIYMQSYLGYSATISGLVVMPGAIIMGAMGPVAGRIFDKHGPRALALTGLSLLAASSAVFAFVGDQTSVIFIAIVFTIRLFAMSLVNMPLNTWAMNALDNSVMNHGTSVSNTLRQVAGSLGTALFVSVSTAASAQASLSTDATHAGIHGINVAFAACTALIIVGLILAFIFVKNTSADALTSDPQNTRRGIIESIMKKDVFTLHERATVFEAVKLFADKGISAAPITDTQGHVMGFISDGDVARYLAKTNHAYTDQVAIISLSALEDKDIESRIDRLMQLKALDIASPGVISADIHTDFAELCRIIGQNHLKKIPITEQGQIVGVINRSDIMRYSLNCYVSKHNDLPNQA